jgi:hypothetical protein
MASRLTCRHDRKHSETVSENQRNPQPAPLAVSFELFIQHELLVHPAGIFGAVGLL